MPVIAGSDQGYGMEFLSRHFGPALREAGIDLMISGHTHRFASLSGEESGFGYPVIISSNNSFTEVTVSGQVIKVVVKDTKGSEIFRSEFRRR
jgi:hypothetical protein